MENKISIKEFIEFIEKQNGRMYHGDDLTQEQEQIAKENGFVVVFGYSDDNAEFRGALRDEVGCYDGGTVFEENGYYINAEWCKGDICWTYDTNIPHETFLIYDDEDDSVFCQAIVFDYFCIHADHDCMNCIHYEKCKKEYVVDNNNIPLDCSIGLSQSGNYSLGTMLDILKGRLPKGLTVASVKETNEKYKITFDYQGDRATAELSKVCASNSHNKNADNAIITAMSSIMLNRGDMDSAKKWLDKLDSKEDKQEHDTKADKQDNETEICKNCLYKEICKTYNSFGIDTPYNDESTCELFKNKDRFVEVVRCRDCKYRLESDITDRSFCSYYEKNMEVQLDDFCSYGERKDFEN